MHLIINNTIPLDDYNIDSCFNQDLYLGSTSYFPDKHKHFFIDQYGPSDAVVRAGNQIVEKLKRIDKNFPKNHKLISGAHIIRHHVPGQKLGCIPPHTDRGLYCGITLFVNKVWDKWWGGWNWIEHNDTKEIIVNWPEYNKCVVIYSPLMHGCTPVWETDKIRRSFQYFIKTVD